MAPEASGTSCASGERPWLGLQFEPALRGLELATLNDLRAGLQPRGIDVCELGRGPSSEPAARVNVSVRTPSPLVVNIEVEDTLTHKSVRREMDLSRVPNDGQAFAIALGTDELVWASWAELAFERSEHEKNSAPPEVERGVRDDLPARGRPTLYAVTRGSYERFSGGQSFWGGDLGLVWPFAGRWGAQLWLGAREGFTIDAPHGRIESDAFVAEGNLELSVVDVASLQLALTLGPRFARMRLQGNAESSNTADRAVARSLIVGSGGVVVRVALGGPIWLLTGAALGYPLLGAEVSDSGQVVAGATGLEVSGHLGLGVGL